MPPSRLIITDSQLRIGAALGLVHVLGALTAHFAIPKSLETRVGLLADPWFRRETGTVNAGFAYGLIRVMQGRRDATFVRATAISGLLMAAVRALATLRGRRRGPLSAMVVGSDLLLGIGGLVLADQFEREQQPCGSAAPPPRADTIAANGEKPPAATPTNKANTR